MTYAWFDVTRNAGIARIMHMSYRSKTYTWNDIILVKRSMIRVFLVLCLFAARNILRRVLLFLSCRRAPERPWFQYHWSQGLGVVSVCDCILGTRFFCKASLLLDLNTKSWNLALMCAEIRDEEALMWPEFLRAATVRVFVQPRS